MSIHFEQELEEKEEKDSVVKALAKEGAFYHIKNPNPKKTRTTKGVQVFEFDLDCHAHGYSSGIAKNFSV